MQIRRQCSKQNTVYTYVYEKVQNNQIFSCKFENVVYNDTDIRSLRGNSRPKSRGSRDEVA